ncbi:MAG: FAD-dependent oxidoreductase [Acidobacteria bacterium]|nr:FAD-dependent oxidoreductase [Acidobacteriota bacterium]
MSKRVVIIGGGFAGLAAGVDLSERGYDVQLLERRNHLGGRAYSFADAQTGDTVDNGQHLFMGCYVHTIAFLKKIHCLDKLKFQTRPQIDFLDTEHLFTTFDCPPLPAPFHVLAGLFRLQGLTVGDKLRALNIGKALRGKAAKNGALSVTEWLKTLHQSARIRERFWYPMAIATLNENPDIASAKMLKKVLQEAFGAGREASALGISSVGLSELYTDGAQAFIESRGGKIHLRAQVDKLLRNDGKVIAVALKNGERLEADYVISAVPPNVLGEILDEEARRNEFAYLEKLHSAPIVSINLWFDKPVTDREFIGLLGTRVQWLFNKDLLNPQKPKSNHLALVISAAHDYMALTKTQLVELALAELHQLIPASREANLLHSTIVKERDATLSHTVASDDLRPHPQTSLTNFFLAGDWTNTGLPATIESAVLSGHTAAALIARS